MAKPNTKFNLSVRDIEVIEHALRAKAGRRGLAIAQGETSPQLRDEMMEIQSYWVEYTNKRYLPQTPKRHNYVSG